jgi:hypothetical protein
MLSQKSETPKAKWVFKAHVAVQTPRPLQVFANLTRICVERTPVKRVIDRHGICIWADGRVGESASFSFTLGARP